MKDSDILTEQPEFAWGSSYEKLAAVKKPAEKGLSKP